MTRAALIRVTVLTVALYLLIYKLSETGGFGIPTDVSSIILDIATRGRFFPYNPIGIALLAFMLIAYSLGVALCVSLRPGRGYVAVTAASFFAAALFVSVGLSSFITAGFYADGILEPPSSLGLMLTAVPIEVMLSVACGLQVAVLAWVFRRAGRPAR